MKLFKIVFEETKRIINSNDPVGLVDEGAPDDEYDTLTGKIVALLRMNHNKNSLAKEVKKIFSEAFTTEAPDNESAYLNMAEQLLDMKNRLRW